MKPLLIAVVLLLTFSSCIKVLNTHSQVMHSYKDKAAVTAQFGVPTEKINTESGEEWIYNMKQTKSTMIAGVRSNTYVVISDSNAHYYDNLDSAGSGKTGQYKRYVSFTFDSSGMVKKWDSQRVNYMKTALKKKATTWVLAGTAVLVGLFIYGIIYFVNNYAVLSGG